MSEPILELDDTDVDQAPDDTEPDIATRRAAKFWVAGLGTLTAAVLAAAPDSPRWLFELPLNAASAPLSAARKSLTAFTVPVLMSATDATFTGSIGSDPNIAVASGDVFYASFTYEAA